MRYNRDGTAVDFLATTDLYSMARPVKQEIIHDQSSLDPQWIFGAVVQRDNLITTSRSL
jgi:hypothetical protein